MIEYIKGNLLTEKNIMAIAHCTNCKGEMKSGIALSIKEQYPLAYEAYKRCEASNGLKLGEISYVGLLRDEKPFVIFNLNGQYDYKTDSNSDKRYVNYEAIFSGLEKMRKICELSKSEPKPTVGFPYKMGCDRAGGDWRIVGKMIEVAFDGYTGQVIVVEWDGTK